jgi:hypothetical protein
VLEAEERAELAIGRLRTGIQVELGASAPARDVVGAGGRLEVAVLGADAAGDAQAGFGAGDEEEAGAEGGSDTDVLDRGRLADRKIGGRTPSRSDESRCGTEEKALNELHW